METRVKNRSEVALRLDQPCQALSIKIGRGIEMKRKVLLEIVISTVVLITPVLASSQDIIDKSSGLSGQLENSEFYSNSIIKLTLDEAVQLALRQNPDLLAIREKTGLARARAAITRQSTYDPRFELEYEGDKYTANEGVRDLQLGLALTFELRGQKGWRKRIGKSGVLSAAGRLKQAEWNLRSRVKVAYYGLQFLKQNIELAGKRLEVTQRLMEVAEARLRSQQIPELQVNFVRLEYHQASNAFRRISGQLPLEHARFARLLGLPSGARFNTAGEFLPRETKELNDTTLLQRAITSRGDLASLRAELQGAEAQVRLEKALIWPGADVEFFYRQSDDLAGSGATQQINRDRFFGLKLSMPLPILSWRSGQIREAESEVKIIQARLNALGREILVEVSEVAQLVRVLREILQVYKDELSILSEQNLADIERAFVAGEVGMTQVLRAQDDFVEVTQNYYEIQYEYLEAEAKLEAIVGPPLSDSGRGAQ